MRTFSWSDQPIARYLYAEFGKYFFSIGYMDTARNIDFRLQHFGKKSNVEYSSVLHRYADYLLRNGDYNKRRVQPRVYYRLDCVCFDFADICIFYMVYKGKRGFSENYKRWNCFGFRHVRYHLV